PSSRARGIPSRRPECEAAPVRDDDVPQLPLFGGEVKERPREGAAARPRLVVVRGRGHLWARPRQPGVRLWTFHELMERVRLLGFLADDEGAVRDDGAALWASAAALARRSP